MTAHTELFASLARVSVGVAALGCVGALAAAAPVAQEEAEHAQPFVRSRNVDGVTGFETAVRSYRRADGTGPIISLVGAVHIGDASYYAKLVASLAASETVLYESVLPRGAFGTQGTTDLQRQRRTQDAMLFLRDLMQRFEASEGVAPSALAPLRAFIVGRDTRLARPFDLACEDGWHRPLAFACDSGVCTLTSLGADGLLGGVGVDLDLVLGTNAAAVARDDAAHDDEVHGDAAHGDAAHGDAAPKEKRDLYKDLADALGVTLQVRAINYDQPGWLPADLAMEDLLDRLWKRGERSMTLEMLGNDSGLAQSVVRMLLSVVSNSPTFKKMVVQALGSSGTQARSALGDVDTRIIIDERNDAVIEQLKSLLATPTPPSSIAIFYGAAHMHDFEATLKRDLHLEPASVAWHTAMQVDEWSEAKIRARIAQFEEARAALLARDPNGAYPEVARIESRLTSLRERLPEASDAQ